MRKRRQARTDFIDFRFNMSAKRWWELEKDGVETRVINLRRRAHEPSGSRMRALFPLAMSRSDCRMELSNSGVNCSSSSITSSNHSRICRSSSCESLRNSSSTCSTFVTNKSFNRYLETASLAGNRLPGYRRIAADTPVTTVLRLTQPPLQRPPVKSAPRILCTRLPPTLELWRDKSA